MAWDQLLRIQEEARAMQSEDETRTPVACPNDGEPLRESASGPFCPFDGWKPGDPAADGDAG